jgi:hypothetical protein
MEGDESMHQAEGGVAVGRNAAEGAGSLYSFETL